jgi:hypothetical protein
MLDRRSADIGQELRVATTAAEVHQQRPLEVVAATGELDRHQQAQRPGLGFVRAVLAGVHPGSFAAIGLAVVRRDRNDADELVDGAPDKTSADITTRTRCSSTARSYSLRKLVGPPDAKPYTAAIAITTLGTVPYFASPKLMKIADCDSSTAAKPAAHHMRGHAISITAATTSATADASHNRPAGLEIGCVSAGSSASSNAFAKPRR